MNKTAKQCCSCKQVKLLSEFGNNKSRPDGKHSDCKTCRKAYNAQRDPYRNDIKSRPTKAMAQLSLSHQEYDELYQQQNGLCAICGLPETGKNQYSVKHLAVDHDHITGKVGGLLCYRCNTRLGVLEDQVFYSSAISYLARYK